MAIDPVVAPGIKLLLQYCLKSTRSRTSPTFSDIAEAAEKLATHSKSISFSPAGE